MRKSIIIIALCVAMWACAAHIRGQMSTLPEPVDLTSAAEVIIIRPSHFGGSAISYTIALDHQDFLAIRNGEHTRIWVEPGTHVFTVKVPVFLGVDTTEESIEIDCRANETHYLVTRQSFTSTSLSVINHSEGEELIGETEYLALEQ